MFFVFSCSSFSNRRPIAHHFIWFKNARRIRWIASFDAHWPSPKWLWPILRQPKQLQTLRRRPQVLIDTSRSLLLACFHYSCFRLYSSTECCNQICTQSRSAKHYAANQILLEMNVNKEEWGGQRDDRGLASLGAVMEGEWSHVPGPRAARGLRTAGGKRREGRGERSGWMEVLLRPIVTQPVHLSVSSLTLAYTISEGCERLEGDVTILWISCISWSVRQEVATKIMNDLTVCWK